MANELRERVRALLGDDLLEVNEQYREALQSHERLKSKVKLLEIWEKKLLATLREEYRKESKTKIAQGILDDKAYASLAFAEHLVKRKELTLKMADAFVEVESIKRHWETLRSYLSFSREESKLSG